MSQLGYTSLALVGTCFPARPACYSIHLLSEMNGVIIGAASSGSGKTTFSMGLMRALCRRGLVVQPFKCGPDYIDPLFHRMASGRESVNLDTRLSSRRHVGDLYAHYGAGADIGVVEGVMGLFDGFE